MKKLVILIINIILITSISINVYASVVVPEDIRIGIYYGSTAKESVKIEYKSNFVLGIKENDEFISKLELNNKIITLSVDEKDETNIKIYVGTVLTEQLKGPIYIVPLDENTNKIFIDSKGYRGKVEVSLKNNLLTVVNELKLQEYLYSVVPSEIQSTSNIEAIKAQAVAARTYAIKENKRHSLDGFHLCSTTHCQMYRGTEWETASTTNAVNSTNGEVITYNDELISAFYFATSGGYTETVTNVWTENLPYLKAVKDEYEVTSSPWSKTLTKDQVKEKLLSRNIDIGDIQKIEILELTQAGRVYSLKVTGTTGTKTLTKEATRIYLGFQSQMYTVTGGNSTTTKNVLDVIDENGNVLTSDISVNDLITTENITIDKDTKILTADGEISIPTITTTTEIDTFVFTGKGNGHGVGMSQNGARGMALNGFTYDQILKHYYSGIEIQK